MVTYIMAVGTIALHVALVIFILVTLLSARWREWLHERVGRHGVLVSLIIVAASLVGSLFYSEVAGFAACIICWLIRVLVYPQLILLGVYYYKPRRWLLIVALVMSVTATLAGAYQIALQSGGAAYINCGIVESLGSCETEYFKIFGYVTIAVMSMLSTAALSVCQAVSLHRKHFIKPN
jgi:disulfide bond formation protein DsbB